MIDAAFVFPLTTLGITLASATRNFSTPSTLSRGSTGLFVSIHGQRLVADQTDRADIMPDFANGDSDE